jgi:adenylosuccinate synthase
VGADDTARCVPVYEELEGWRESTVGIKRLEDLPKAARVYLDRIEATTGVGIDMISTGPDREETMLRRHPFL